MLGAWTVEGLPQPTDERPLRSAPSTGVPWLPPICDGCEQLRVCHKRRWPIGPGFTGPTLARWSGLNAMSRSTTSVGSRGLLGSMSGSYSLRLAVVTGSYMMLSLGAEGSASCEAAIFSWFPSREGRDDLNGLK